MKPSEASRQLAEEVCENCREQGVELLLIGAVALAAHGYPRDTEDIDFAIAVDPSRLPAIATHLEQLGVTAVASPPKPQDPLGGIVTVRRGDAAPIQIVNFDNSPTGGCPQLVKEALDRSTQPQGGVCKLPTVEDVVLFNLYAGGAKSQVDILELLTRTRVDVDTLKERATEYRMSAQLDSLLSLAGL